MEPKIVKVAPAPAVTRRRRQAKRAPPAPAVAYAAPILGIEYVPPAPAGICAAPVSEYAASEPTVTDTAPAPVREYVAVSPCDVRDLLGPENKQKRQKKQQRCEATLNGNMQKK